MPVREKTGGHWPSLSSTRKLPQSSTLAQLPQPKSASFQKSSSSSSSLKGNIKFQTDQENLREQSNRTNKTKSYVDPPASTKTDKSKQEPLKSVNNPKCSSLLNAFGNKSRTPLKTLVTGQETVEENQSQTKCKSRSTKKLAGEAQPPVEVLRRSAKIKSQMCSSTLYGELPKTPKSKLDSEEVKERSKSSSKKKLSSPPFQSLPSPPKTPHEKSREGDSPLKSAGKVRGRTLKTCASLTAINSHPTEDVDIDALTRPRSSSGERLPSSAGRRGRKKKSPSRLPVLRPDEPLAGGEVPKELLTRLFQAWSDQMSWAYRAHAMLPTPRRGYRKPDNSAAAHLKTLRRWFPPRRSRGTPTSRARGSVVVVETCNYMRDKEQQRERRREREREAERERERERELHREMEKEREKERVGYTHSVRAGEVYATFVRGQMC